MPLTFSTDDVIVFQVSHRFNLITGHSIAWDRDGSNMKLLQIILLVEIQPRLWFFSLHVSLGVVSY